MPENAEVALTAEILAKYLNNKSLTSIKFISGRYTKNPPLDVKQFKKALPLKVTNINSKGKFLWFALSGDWFIFNTFGLTGMWGFQETEYTRAILTFTNKTAYFSDMRNFGTLKFVNGAAALTRKLATLGPDFLKENVDISAIKNYHVPVVKLLMDQKRIGSGLGNYLTAEILYRAGISPHRLGSQLTSVMIKKLSYWINYMVKLSYVDNHIGYMTNLEKEAAKISRRHYHPEIRLKDREFTFLVYGQKHDPDGNVVKADKIISGRTTYWVQAVQK